MAAPPGEHPDDLPPPASRLWWAVPAVGILLLAIVALVFGGPESVDYGTSYDASDGGFRAAFLLLDELRYPVERSRRPTGGEVRWVLFPTKADAKSAGELDAWVDRGGLALLALDDAEFARRLGLQVTVRGGGIRLSAGSRGGLRLRPASPEKGEPTPAEAPDVRTLLAGETEVTGPPGGRAWGRIGVGPLVTIYPHGKGELWLLHRPDVLTNANLRGGADNAVLTCRLAEAMLRERPGGRLAFDEFSHGLRDRPGVLDLLFRPPVLGVTIEVLLLGLLALWHFGPRFGSTRAGPPPSRRSKEEFLDAMAELLTRKGDRAEAFRTVRDDFLRRLEAELGLPAGTPVQQTAREAARRRGVAEEPLLVLLTAESPPGGSGVAAFLAALHLLEAAANECLPRRRSR